MWSIENDLFLVSNKAWFEWWVNWAASHTYFGHVIKHLVAAFENQPGYRPAMEMHESLKMWVAHAPGMLGTFSLPRRVTNPDTHHGMCVTHVPWCMPGSLTSSFLWSWWRGKHSRHSWRMHNQQLCVSGKRTMAQVDSTHIVYYCSCCNSEWHGKIIS